MSFSVPPNWLPVFDGMAMLVPTLETPAAGAGLRRLRHAGHGAGVDLVVDDVHRDVQDGLLAAAERPRASVA